MLAPKEDDQSLMLIYSKEDGEEEPDDGCPRSTWRVEHLSGMARDVVMATSSASSAPRLNPLGRSAAVVGKARDISKAKGFFNRLETST